MQNQPAQFVEAWTIAEVRPTSYLNTRAQLVEGQEITVHAADGHVFSVKVANSEFNKEGVKAAIDQYWQNYLDIRYGLKGEITDLSGAT